MNYTGKVFLPFPLVALKVNGYASVEELPYELNWGGFSFFPVSGTKS